MKNYALFDYCRRLSESFEKLLRDASILDVGCGDGRFWVSHHFSKIGRYAVGVDIQYNESWVKLKEKKENVDFLVCDACHLPFRSAAFDVVFEKDMLHHLSEYMKALDEIFRVSKKNIVIIEANRYNLVSYMHLVKLSGHNHFSQKQFRRLILSKTIGNNVTFKNVEAHFYPFRHKFMLKLFILFENLMEKAPLINRVLSYNIAIITK